MAKVVRFEEEELRALALFLYKHCELIKEFDGDKDRLSKAIEEVIAQHLNLLNHAE
jgi:hypothetical protein